MAIESKTVRMAKLENRFPELTETILASARAKLASLEPIAARIGKAKFDCSPIPMQGGKYGWYGETLIPIDGSDDSARATVTFTHPEATSDASDINAVAMHKLATLRKAGRQAQTTVTNVSAALAKLPVQEQIRIARERLEALTAGAAVADAASDDDEDEDE